MKTLMSDELSSKQAAPIPDETMWRAVVARDLVSDGAFVYGVRSTGIYCRPSCGARRPASADGVEFFADAECAEEAGYRACFRCKPREAGAWQRELARIQWACRILEKGIPGHAKSACLNGRKGDGLTELAAQLGGVSPFHLQKSFKRILGISPKQYVDAVRLRQFKAMLRTGDPVGVAAREIGLGSPGTLYGRAAVKMGIAPAQYRAGAPGVRIDFAVVPCPLDWMLLAATESGVCAIRLGSDAARLKNALRNEFPNAGLCECSETIAPFLLAVLSALGMDKEASAAAQRLPLDIRATAFQWRVWSALRKLPPGITRSYGEIARLLDADGSARAVGTACASNPVALAIPCHRAVRANGGRSGYRWGAGRKKALLEHEEAINEGRWKKAESIIKAR